MKFNKIVLVLMLVFATMVGVAFSASTSPFCTYAAPVQDSTDWNPMSNDTYNTVTIGGDTTFGSLLVVTPRLNTTIIKCENFNAVNKSTNTLLYYKRVVILNVTNSTGTILGTGNYTLANNTVGVYNITWSFSDSSNSSVLGVCYNKTLVKNQDNISSPAGQICGACTLLDTNGGTDYGINYNARLATYDLNNTGYAAQWTTITRTCVARDGCAGTRNTIFAGFALIALFAIIGAAFLIINIISHSGMDIAAMSVTVITIIGLAIVLIVGYLVTGIVSNVVCTV